MSSRMAICFLIILATTSLAPAKNKKKQPLPDYVLKAQTVAVVIRPDAGEPLTNPRANQTARDDVKNAITEWRRFTLISDPQTADLIIAVRKGYANGPTVRNSPADEQPMSLPTGVPAGQHGRTPGLTRGGPVDTGPRITNEAGLSEDSFEVYMGGVDYPLDAPPVWRYIAKDALSSPQVAAVEQFRNAINESEKRRQVKP
jgi:hypothetical protein